MTTTKKKYQLIQPVMWLMSFKVKKNAELEIILPPLQPLIHVVVTSADLQVILYRAAVGDNFINLLH